MRLNRIVIGSAILTGLTLVVSGTGKLPGQTEFADALLKSFWTPLAANIIVHYLPWIEVGLGALLFLGVFPRIAAIICLFLFAGFMSNNVWALANSAEFPECAYCFGVWEKFFGALAPSGALGLDIVLFILAMIILVLNKGKFLSYQPWFIKNKKETARYEETRSDVVS